METPPPHPPDWDQLAQRAVYGLVKNNQKHQAWSRRRARGWWLLGWLLVLGLSGVGYYFREPLRIWGTPLIARLSGEVRQLWQSKPNESWPSESFPGESLPGESLPTSWPSREANTHEAHTDRREPAMGETPVNDS